jgi:hypothetical protein
MRIQPLEHLGDTAVSVGDGPVALALAALGVFVFIRLLQLGNAKVQRLQPGKDAPWTGRYETKVPAHAVVEKGKNLPPPQPAKEGAKWRLKEAHSRSGWLFVVLVAAVLGALAYGQVDVSGLQQLISNPTGPPNLSTPAPQPQRAPRVDHHASAPSQHLKAHSHHGVRPHRPHN